MSAEHNQKTQAQIKADKRAAALRDNLKKRKAFIKDGAQETSKDKKNVNSQNSQ